jgi:hypothetical protein
MRPWPIGMHYVLLYRVFGMSLVITSAVKRRMGASILQAMAFYFAHHHTQVIYIYIYIYLSLLLCK